jgi:hypothetical protein
VAARKAAHGRRALKVRFRATAMRAAVALHGARSRIDRRAAMAMRVRRAGLRASVPNAHRVVKGLLARPVGPRVSVLSVRRGGLTASVLNAHRAAKVLPVHRAALKVNVEIATAASGQPALHVMTTRAGRLLALLVARAGPTTRAVPAPRAPVVASTPARVVNALRGPNATSRVGLAHPSVHVLAPTAQAPSRAARSTGRRVTKARAGIRQASAIAGVTSVRLRANAASARSPHPSNVPTGIVRNALRAMTAAREHPLHAGSAIVRRAQSTRSAPIAAFGVIALPAHARRAATTTPLQAAASATASVRHAPTRHRATQPRRRDRPVRKNPHRAPPRIVATMTTPRAPCAFPS